MCKCFRQIISRLTSFAATNDEYNSIFSWWIFHYFQSCRSSRISLAICWACRAWNTENRESPWGQHFVVTGDTTSCRYDNVRCHQLRQSLHHDNQQFSVNRNIFSFLNFGLWRKSLWWLLAVECWSHFSIFYAFPCTISKQEWLPELNMEPKMESSVFYHYSSGLILGLRRANERRRYKVTPSLIGWAQT